MSRIGLASRSCRNSCSRADPCRKPIAPGGFDQHTSRRSVAGLGNAALASRAAAGMLGRHQTEIRHELAGIGEARDVAKLSYVDILTDFPERDTAAAWNFTERACRDRGLPRAWWKADVRAHIELDIEVIG